MNYYNYRCPICGHYHCTCKKEEKPVIKPCDTLFCVQDDSGNSVPLKYTDKMVFTSKTIDITVSEGSAIVNMEYEGEAGATGATGPAALDSAQPYTPGKTDYPVGSVVIYNGKPYIVTYSPQKSTPDIDPTFTYLEITSNVPGTQGATGATGPAALESAQSYEPEKTDYPIGSVVIYNGKPYLVTSSPQSGGTPDIDPAYSYFEITSDAPGTQGATGPTGPTGPAALETAQNYVPEKTDYSVGSVVIYDGKPYLVVSSPQSGETPDNDPAFAYLEITSDAPASQGATGATGATSSLFFSIKAHHSEVVCLCCTFLNICY